MFEISATKLDTYMQCPLKFRFRYVERIEPEETSPALAFGSAVHGTIKHYYKRLMEGRKLEMNELAAAFIQDWEVACSVPVRWNGSMKGGAVDFMAKPFRMSVLHDLIIKISTEIQGLSRES
jgi:hypothetical protein